MPEFVEPMLAQAVEELPTGADWGLEPKLDGHRSQIRKDGDDVDIRTRRNKKPIVNVRGVLASAAQLKADQAIIDGELTALDENGIPSFRLLQNRDSKSPIVFWAFDLLFHNGRDIRAQPLSQRQALLADVINGSGLRLCVALPGKPADVIQAVKAMGLEGIVAKRRTSEYRSGDRNRDWQKKRFDRGQEFVIGGYRPSGKDSIDSLLVGVYEAGNLKFAAKVGKGLNRWNRASLRAELQPLNSSRCPFSNLPTSSKRGKSSWDSGGVSAEEMSEIQWVRPRLVAEISFVEWTSGDLLRHAGFVGLRIDKPASDVVRET